MSIYDVAREAGVSAATVSRFINKSVNVVPEKAELIRSAMKKLKYEPAMIRPGPRPRNRQGIVHKQVLLLSLGKFGVLDLYNMPALPKMLNEIQLVLHSTGLNLVLAQSVDGTIPSITSARNFDGILVFGKLDPMPEKIMALLRSAPSVWFFREHSDPDGIFDHVFYDNKKIGGMAFSYLHGKGCRNLAVIVTEKEHSAFSLRSEAFVSAAREMGCLVDVFQPADSNPGIPIARKVDEILGKMMNGRRRHDGIFVTSDDSMLAVFNSFRNRGIEPEQDIKFIGCNNDPQFMGQMSPRPATIDIRLDVIGRKAVELLLQRIRNPEEDGTVEVFIKPLLVPAEKDEEQLKVS
ncbi:MAG: hypothetical protein A2X48_00145 [Lentisphaerae bacterium GWF2_49_21]|nr:MAG: hypothetical protein A2X48_00145 [Lentisphaerae bacterium GWF2_49_21]